MPGHEDRLSELTKNKTNKKKTYLVNLRVSE